MSGGGCVRVGGPPIIESKDSKLTVGDGEKVKIAFLSIVVSRSVGYVALILGFDKVIVSFLMIFLVGLGDSSTGQILKLLSRWNLGFFLDMSRSRIRRDCKSLLEEYKSGPSPGNFAVSWKVTFFAANELNEDELLSNLLVLQRISPNN